MLPQSVEESFRVCVNDELKISVTGAKTQQGTDTQRKPAGLTNRTNWCLGDENWTPQHTSSMWNPKLQAQEQKPDFI